MKVILDTNALLISIPRKSKYRLIFDNLVSGKFELFISNEILTEYVEILSIKTNLSVAANIADLLLSLDNVKLMNVFFHWDLIKKDPDDNKFVDAAISGNCDFLICWRTLSFLWSR